MSYQVIARKYRPQSFNDLTGQEHITRTLSHALDNKRLHHAYLFSGVRGTGKTTTARILAKGLNCHEGVTSRPCLQCPSCTEIAAGNSMDVLEIDAASNTGVDNVREVIINNISMAPARDRYKVFVIDEVHMLSGSAFNALLKTLEEPPSHVIFVMATTELHKVPDTILSRCQQFEFRQIPTEKIFQRLREIAGSENISIKDSALREIARAGAGSLRDAQSAFDQVIAFSGEEITEEDVTASLGLVSAATLGSFAEAIIEKDTSTIVNLVEDVTSRGYDLRNFARELMAYLRHLLLVKSGIRSGEVIGVADVEVERLDQLASRYSEEDIVRCFHLLADTEKQIKDSPHPRFQLELGLVKLTHAIKLRSLDELINRLTRLADLEKKPGGESGGPSGSTGSTPRSPGVSSQSSTRPPSQTSGYGSAASSYRSESESNLAAQQPRGAKASLPEPPDFPDMDLSEPVDPSDSEPMFSTGSNAGRRQTANKPNLPQTAVASGQELDAIMKELHRLNRGLVLTSIDDAQQVEFRDNTLIVTFAAENLFAKRVRDSGTLFKDIGQRLLNVPVRIDVRISGQIEERIDEADVKLRQMNEQALQSQAVRLILEQTRGEILSVKEKE